VWVSSCVNATVAMQCRRTGLACPLYSCAVLYWWHSQSRSRFQTRRIVKLVEEDQSCNWSLSLTAIQTLYFTSTLALVTLQRSTACVATHHSCTSSAVRVRPALLAYLVASCGQVAAAQCRNPIRPMAFSSRLLLLLRISLSTTALPATALRVHPPTAYSHTC
jgi:hypothetical protein